MIEIKKTKICEGCGEVDLELRDYRISCFDNHDWRLFCRHSNACERIVKMFEESREDK